MKKSLGALFEAYIFSDLILFYDVNRKIHVTSDVCDFS